MKAVVYACMADGLEEVECLAAVDVMIRSGITVKLVSMTGNPVVTGAHGIRITADLLWEESQPDEADCIFLPGGMPGTRNLEGCAPLMEELDRFYAAGKWIAAICAAPSVFGHRGYLKGREAVCYPSFEGELTGATVLSEAAVADGNVITGRGMGCAIPFGLIIVEKLISRAAADALAESIVYER